MTIFTIAGPVVPYFLRSYGPITCKNVEDGDIKLKTSSGKIKLLGASFGNCDVYTSYGSITCDNLKGESIKLHSGSGSVNVTDAVADTADVSTSYGRIKCMRITTGEITVKSSSGSIEVICSDSSPADIAASLVTSCGNIDFVTPPDYAGQIDMSTSYGSIRTDLPITISGKISKKKLKGAIGEGEGSLYLHTSSGSIEIRQQQEFSKNAR